MRSIAAAGTSRASPRERAPVVEGNLVAVAGYVKNDELIGVVGQEPRILFPGTVASRPDNGLYLELENVHIEEGLSGGAVFDPGTGDVLGIVTSRTSDRRGGFADSAALVVLPFLEASNVAVSLTRPVTHAAPKPRAVAVATPPPPLRLPLPSPPPRSASARHHSAGDAAALVPIARPRAVRAASAIRCSRSFPPRPRVQRRLRRHRPLRSLRLSVPARDLTGEIVSWQAGQAAPSRFVYTRAGCRMAVTIDVRNLQFIVAHEALVPPHRRGALLGIIAR